MSLKRRMLHTIPNNLNPSKNRPYQSARLSTMQVGSVMLHACCGPVLLAAKQGPRPSEGSPSRGFACPKGLPLTKPREGEESPGGF